MYNSKKDNGFTDSESTDNGISNLTVLTENVDFAILAEFSLLIWCVESDVLKSEVQSNIL